MAPSSLRSLADLAAPPRCGACGEPCSGGARICRRCERSLLAGAPVVEPGPAGVEVAVAAGAYDGVIRDLVVALKFGRRLALAGDAAEAMARACPDGVLRGEIVPVPAAPLRRLWRGFDPAEEISIALGRVAGIDVTACLRRGQGPRQVRRSRAARLAGPPRVRASGAVPARAVLVDDVHTTGATLAACAAALRAGGCGEVAALTLARAKNDRWEWPGAR